MLDKIGIAKRIAKEKHIEEKRKMKEEINRLEREKAERRAKKRELDKKECKSKEFNKIKDPITYYESFSKKPIEFRKLHASSGSDSRSYSSSESRSESSDDFPSPRTPIKKLDKKNKNIDKLNEKINDLQRKLNEKDIEIRKLKSQLRK